MITVESELAEGHLAKRIAADHSSDTEHLIGTGALLPCHEIQMKPSEEDEKRPPGGSITPGATKVNSKLVNAKTMLLSLVKWAKKKRTVDNRVFLLAFGVLYMLYFFYKAFLA